jgi:hypothetical protein
MPQNRDVLGDANRDKLLRDLDCAVIRYLHDSIDQQLSNNESRGALERFDSVRGLFREGDPVYPGSGFYERTHSQIAVRSLDCIKGVFIPRLLEWPSSVRRYSRTARPIRHSSKPKPTKSGSA